MARYLGAYGRAAYGAMGASMGGLQSRRRGGGLLNRATELGIEAAEVAAGAALAGAATGMSQRAGLGGNTPLLPIPVPLALSVLGLVGAGTLGPKAEPHLMEVTKGALASYISTLAMKLGAGTQPAAAGVGAAWTAKQGLGGGIGGNVFGQSYPYLPSNQYVAQYGATPETERLFAEAGI